MKRTILAIHLLLLTALQAVADDYKVKVESKQLTVTVRQDGTTYTIGNGRVASIPQYEEGTLNIPRITSTTGDQNVVGKFAFRFCTGINKIVIEEGITSIEDFAFIGCSGVTSIELPATLTKVGRGAFIGLPNLSKIVCKATTAPVWLRADVFSYEGTAASMAEDAKKRILYVPAGHTSDYSTYKFNNEVGWADAFARIYEIDENPQEITSLADLQAFRNAVNTGSLYKNSNSKMVILTADIDLSSIEYWEPIGTNSNYFDGVFNGGGHIIKNLKVNQSSNNYQGLFGYADDATIYNLHLQNPKVAGSDYVGSVLGYAANGTRVSDVLVTSDATDYTVYATSGNGGGIVGYASNGTIERCMFSGRVKCMGGTGGIVGNVLNNMTITDCSASSYLENINTTNGQAIGGIVGSAGGVNINRCLARNQIIYPTSPTPTIGAIVGTTNNNVTSTISNCAYWTDIDISVVIGHSLLSTTQSGNVKYSTEADMNQDKTKDVMGTNNWHYFTDNYIDYPVPATLINMYIANCVNTTADNGIVYRLIGASYEVVGYNGNATELTIPATYNEKPVTAILDNVFMGNNTLTTINLGSSLQSIGKSAFENCDALTAIDLPDAVTNVKENAFYGCDNLTSFNIGTGFKNYEGNFLVNCPKLTTLTASRGNNNGFLCLDNVLIHNSTGDFSHVVICAPGKTGDYTIPTGSPSEDYVWIKSSSFTSCTELTSITFPGGKRYKLDNALFEGTYNLRYVDMSNVDGFVDNNKNSINVNVDRSDPDNPFYGLDECTIVYLPQNNTAEVYEPNVFIMNGNNGATANYILLDDEMDFNPKVPVTAEDGVSYRRDINYTSQNEDESYDVQGFTVYLPYSLKLYDEHAKVYALSTIENVSGSTTVTFSEVANKQMAAYTPYYVVAEGEQEIDFSVSKETPIAVPPTSDPAAISGFMFKGTTVEIPNSELRTKSTYLLQSDGNWHKVPTDKDIPEAYVGAFRAYFQAKDAGAHVLDMVIEDSETTDIQQIRTIDADGTERYYDMNGRQLNSVPQKGMYIHQGKKYINK
jgi:hypothetical protein